MADALQSAEDIKAAALNALGESATPLSDEPKGEPAAPPADPAGEPVAKAEPTAPNPDEPKVDPPAKEEPKEGDKDWKVPGERLQAEVKKRKDVEDENTRLKVELEAAKTPPPDDPGDDPDAEDDDIELKPEVLKAMKKKGFVTQAEAETLAENKARGILDADKRAAADRQQAQDDKRDLSKEFSDKGYPAFEIDKVLPRAIEMVGEKNINKQVLKAAYLEVHAADIEDVLVKRAQATTKKPDADAERPGGSPALKSEPAPGTVKDKTKAAIAAAIPD